MKPALRDKRNLQMSQRKVQASGKFEAVQQEVCGLDHQTAGAGSPPAYNSSHTHPKTSNNYRQTQTHPSNAVHKKKNKTDKRSANSLTSFNIDVSSSRTKCVISSSAYLYLRWQKLD